MADKYDADFAVLTVVANAFDAALRLTGCDEDEHRRGVDWPVARVRAAKGGEHRVVIGRCVDQANASAQGETADILEAWSPRALLVADIGGGIFGGDEDDRDGVSLGDVVFNTSIYYYEHVKETPKGEFDRYSVSLPPSRRLRKTLDLMAARKFDWAALIDRKAPERDPPREAAPKLVAGEIVTGDRLLSDPGSKTVEEIVKRQRARAVDMESAGVMQALYVAQQRGLFVDFLVMRGISDMIDVPGDDNQGTRDRWREFASVSAVAAALAVIQNTRAEGVQPAAHGSPLTTRRLSYLRTKLPAELTEREQMFPLQVTTTSKGTEEILGVDEFLATVEEKLRVVLAGPAGIGKSVFVETVARHALTEGQPLPVVVDLKRWEGNWTQDLSAHPVGERLDHSMEALLRAALLDTPLKAVQEPLEEGDRVLLIVDGLNEVPFQEVGEPILTTLDEFVRQGEGRVSVLVTDRTVGPHYREVQWTALEMKGVEESAIRRALEPLEGPGYDELGDDERDLYVRPFFLAHAVKVGRADLRSQTEVLAQFFEDRGGIAGDDLEAVASFAFGVYAERQRTFEADAIVSAVSAKTVQRLEDAGLLGPAGDRAEFTHQLLHDFLAGYHLARNPGLWDYDQLDLVSFEAGSLDPITMAASLIEPRDEKDRFLRIVYDWNWRAAEHALAETKRSGSDASPELELALLAMLADKRFDPIGGTATRGRDLLARFDDERAAEIRETDTRADLYTYVAAADGPDEGWFADWRTLFVLDGEQTAAGEDEINLLASNEPLLGWTASNVLGRFADERISYGARTIYHARPGKNGTDRAVRWRTLHVVASHGSVENAEFLLRALDDEYMWCRYGAVRSLVEMAAMTEDEEVQGLITRGLSEAIPGLDATPLGQLASAAIYRDPSPGWPDRARPLLEKARDAQKTPVETARWDAKIAEFDQYAEELGR